MELTPLPPIPFVDGDTLLIDNSTLSIYEECERKGEYFHIRGRVKAGEKPALNLGAALHAALKMRYLFGAGECAVLTQARQMVVLEQWYTKFPLETEDYRTLGFAQQVIRAYNEHYKIEPFNLVRRKGTEEFFVEEPFALPLGTVDGKKVVWTGRIDLPVVQHGDFFVGDHKSSSIGGENISVEHQNSSQFKGYSWAFKKKYGVDVKGAMVNYLIVRKPTITGKGKGLEFRRDNIYFEPEIIEEWQFNTLALVKRLLDSHKQGYFPMHTKQCVQKYGKCDYHDVCLMVPKARLPYLYNTEVYEQNAWTPTQPDEIDFTSILAMTEEQLEPYKHVSVYTPKLIDVGDYAKLVEDDLSAGK